MRQCEAPPPGHQAALLHVTVTTEYDPVSYLNIGDDINTDGVPRGAMAEYLGAELAPIPRQVLELVHFIGTITPGPACSCTAALQHCNLQVTCLDTFCRVQAAPLLLKSWRS